MIISPRIDSLDCDDVGPYLPHGLGSVNSMMLGASVRTSRHNVFQVFLRSPDVSAAFQQLSCLLLAAAFVVQCAQDLAHTLKHALNSHEPLTDESPMPLLDDRHSPKTAHMPSKQADMCWIEWHIICCKMPHNSSMNYSTECAEVC